MRGNKFEKSHIHILKSETLSRYSRVTESAQEIVDSIPYIWVEHSHHQRFPILFQKKYHIDIELQFPDQTDVKKEEGLRGL